MIEIRGTTAQAEVCVQVNNKVERRDNMTAEFDAQIRFITMINSQSKFRNDL